MRLQFASLALPLLLLGACERPATDVTVEDAWVRLGATPANPAAGYFTIKGGPADDRLVFVFSPVVIKTELHESSMEGGMMRMAPLKDGVPVPKGSTVEFKPGGKHVMLYNVNPGIVPPRTLTLNFSFASGKQLVAEAKVFRQGDK
ncbi:MAG: copper chaperone PCu(A)C [Sphingomonadaceae bacterium]